MRNYYVSDKIYIHINVLYQCGYIHNELSISSSENLFYSRMRKRLRKKNQDLG